jgi:hypothetical protein
MSTNKHPAQDIVQHSQQLHVSAILSHHRGVQKKVKGSSHNYIVGDLIIILRLAEMVLIYIEKVTVHT